MPEMKSSYEFFLVLSTKQGEEGIESIIGKFQGLIESNSELAKVDRWGKRRLAYLINKEQEGYYILFTFSSAPSFPTELNRISTITDGVLRTLIVKKGA